MVCFSSLPVNQKNKKKNAKERGNARWWEIENETRRDRPICETEPAGHCINTLASILPLAHATTTNVCAFAMSVNVNASAYTFEQMFADF